MPVDYCSRTPSLYARLAMSPFGLTAMFVLGVVMPAMELYSAHATPTIPAPLPVEQNGTCGRDKVVYTRHEIWVDCFMRLGGMDTPRPGDLDVHKISRFLADRLYPWERFFAPSATEIVQRCDQPPLDGWITQKEFEGTTNRACLADADAICHTRDVCERETRHLPPQV
jgi:hypothetical protein